VSQWASRQQASEFFMRRRQHATQVAVEQASNVFAGPAPWTTMDAILQFEQEPAAPPK